MFYLSTRYSNIRDLPYPYKGMLSISNDVDYMQFEFFEALMHYVNGTGKTTLGEGLGLELTSSLFFYSETPFQFSYFDGAEPDAPLSEYAERINTYLKNGYIDTNHAFGDFDFNGSFTRAHAERVYKTLLSMGVSLPIFTNHGSEKNIQNIGTDADYHQGDHETSIAYHSDLFAKAVKYVWTDSFSIEKKRLAGLSGMGKKNGAMPSAITEMKSLNDGQTLPHFYRIRSTGDVAPNFTSFNHQLQMIDWEEFYQNSGIVVLYQHFGVFKKKGKEIETSNATLVQKFPYLLEGFRHLKSEQDKGNLLVIGTYRLLQYYEMFNSTKVLIDEEKGNMEIQNYKSIDNPQDYFSGLTIYCRGNKEYKVFYQEEEMAIDYNGPDLSGQYSISIPMQRLINIWE